MWDQDITTDTVGESIQESTSGYTENRCNGFIKTENQAQRKWARDPVTTARGSIGTWFQEQARSLVVKTLPKDQLSELD